MVLHGSLFAILIGSRAQRIRLWQRSCMQKRKNLSTMEISCRRCCYAIVRYRCVCTHMSTSSFHFFCLLYMSTLPTYLLAINLCNQLEFRCLVSSWPWLFRQPNKYALFSSIQLGTWFFSTCTLWVEATVAFLTFSNDYLFLYLKSLENQGDSGITYKANLVGLTINVKL